MRKSMQRSTSSDLPLGDWYRPLMRKDREALENAVKMELVKASTHRNY